MARPSKRSPTKIARLKAARAAGKGLHATAREIGVSHQTVANWERRAGGKAGRGGRRSVGASEGPPATSASTAAELLSQAVPEGVDDLRARHATVRALLDRMTPALERDEFSAQTYVQLARYADELATRIAELAPPARKDPADDEDLRDAERILLARIESMVAEAEGSAAP